MPLTLQKIEALAPDQSSLNAARKLLKPGGWPRLAWDGGDIVWGECQGSGATPYRVVVSEPDAGYKCSCPSRKFPCKHSLALMWMRAEGRLAFTTANPPDWVKDWTSRRRSVSGKPDASEASPRASIAASEEETDLAPPDPKVEARATAARGRNRQERETAILAGLDELDMWLSDQVERGMAAFVAQSSQACKLIAQRLVDAKASGLATRLENISARLFALPEAMRPMAAVEELGQVYLLAEAYRRQNALTPALKADVRQAVGWTTAREALLADASALRIHGTWRVIAVLTEVQPDRLRRTETWLWRDGYGDGGAPRFALLLDFVPVAAGASSGGYIAGDRLEAELVFYPSAMPLRALVLSSSGGAHYSDAALDLPEDHLDVAYGGYEAALREQPWLGVWPLSFRQGRVRRSGKSLFLCAAGGGSIGFPIRPAQHEIAGPLVSFKALDGVGLWDGYHFTLCWAETELGRWVNV